MMHSHQGQMFEEGCVKIENIIACELGVEKIAASGKNYFCHQFAILPCDDDGHVYSQTSKEGCKKNNLRKSIMNNERAKIAMRERRIQP